MAVKNNRIYHYTSEGTRESHPSVHDLQSTTRLAEGTRESHPSVHDLQSTTRLAESWMTQIMDTQMGFPCPFMSVVIDYFSASPLISINNPILTSF